MTNYIKDMYFLKLETTDGELIFFKKPLSKQRAINKARDVIRRWHGFSEAKVEAYICEVGTIREFYYEYPRENYVKLNTAHRVVLNSIAEIKEKTRGY